jgi:hypothetical protein
MSRNARRSSRIAPAKQRVLAPFQVGVGVFVASFLSLMLFHGMLGISDPYVQFAGSLATQLSFALGTGISLARFLVLNRTLRANDRKVCPCGYVLRGLPDAGICPECGESYEAEQLCRLWWGW